MASDYQEAEFLQACKNGDLETFNRLVREGVNINCRNGEPLREAICNNQVEIWTLLLDSSGINPNLTDENGRGALHVANWFNKEAAVAKLVSMPSVQLNQEDNYGNTPIMMGVRYGTSDVLMVMLNSRGVDIMQVDSQGRGLEHYARDSWRMSEQEKVEIVDIITLERRSRMREVTGSTADLQASSRTAAIVATGSRQSANKIGSNEPNQVALLKDHMNRVAEELHRKLDKEEKDLREKWRQEVERMKQRQEGEKKGIYSKQEKDMTELRSRHRREENELMTKQTKEMYETRLKQEREKEEILARHRDEEDRWEKDKAARISKYMRAVEISETEEEEKQPTSPGLLTRLARETECPVCLSIMTGRVWQCIAGHILCEICHDRPEISSCPTCRGSFIGRAIAVEKMIKTIRGDKS